MEKAANIGLMVGEVIVRKKILLRCEDKISLAPFSYLSKGLYAEGLHALLQAKFHALVVNQKLVYLLRGFHTL